MLLGLKFDIDPEVFNYETDENNCFCEAEGKDNTGSYEDTNEEYEENSDEDPWEDEDEDDPWSDEDEDDPWGDEDEEETEVEDSKNCYGKGVFHLGKQ